VVAIGHRVHDERGAGGAMIELKDLSTLRDLQAVVDHSTVLSRLGEMAAGVAHEIRNPLNAITLHLEPLLWSESLDPAEVREAVETTREQITRLDRAVSGFLKVARLRKLSMSTVAPKEVVEEVADLLAPEATLSGLELVVDCEDDVPSVNADPDVLRQALTNVIKNAIQALPSREGRVLVGCRAGAGEVRFFTHDTGPGMDEDVQARAFDLYMTTKAGGSGVGLPYVRQAMEMHGGRVELKSAEGEGTTVNLNLPAKRRSRRAVSVATPAEGAAP
jgi:signal transduction histidine kinase